VHLRLDEGSGPVVVLLHGQPGVASDWGRVVPLLRGRGVRVLSVDRPGYGAATGAATGWADNAEQLLALLDRLAVEHAVLVGWSWAGGVALRAALDAPARVRGLVLVASVGHRTAVAAGDRLLALPPVRRLTPGLMRRVSRWTPLVVGRSTTRLDDGGRAYFGDESRSWAARGVWQAVAAEQAALVRDTPALSDALGRVAAPAVVLQGWRDTTVAPRAGVALAAALPDARLVALDAGHLVPFEQPEAVVSAITSLAFAPDARAAPPPA